GLTLCAEACVLDADGNVLLVRRAGSGDWSLPARGVQQGETLGEALAHCLRAECGIEIKSAPQLHWIYPNDSQSAFTQSGLYIVRQWELAVPSLPAERAAFFSPTDLPAEMARETAARIGHALEGRTAPEVC